jgi:hypothetical protein
MKGQLSEWAARAAIMQQQSNESVATDLGGGGIHGLVFILHVDSHFLAFVSPTALALDRDLHTFGYTREECSQRV